MSLFIVLLEGVLSYNPPVRKSAFQPFDPFLIQPPPSLQHCLERPTRVPKSTYPLLVVRLIELGAYTLQDAVSLAIADLLVTNLWIWGTGSGSYASEFG